MSLQQCGFLLYKSHLVFKLIINIPQSLPEVLIHNKVYATNHKQIVMIGVLNGFVRLMFHLPQLFSLVQTSLTS